MRDLSSFSFSILFKLAIFFASSILSFFSCLSLAFAFFSNSFLFFSAFFNSICFSFFCFACSILSCFFRFSSAILNCFIFSRSSLALSNCSCFTFFFVYVLLQLYEALRSSSWRLRSSSALRSSS